MEDIEIDISYKELLRLLKRDSYILEDYNLEELRITKVIDRPSKFIGGDRVVILIDEI